MDATLAAALARGHTVDITTTGRHSGRPRRIEIVFHNIDGRLIISGSPRFTTRAWIHNIEADSRITLHLKGPVQADLVGTARVVTDPEDRRAIAAWIVANAWPGMDVEAMVRSSPMIEVTLQELAA